MSFATHSALAAATRKPNVNRTAGSDSSGGDASGLFQTMQSHVDDIRAHLQCGICIRPLYEPFTIACGHTFCYSCLSAWFKSNKTCPDCRSPVKAQPAPAYLIRTLVQMFTSRPELLENGETTAEHTKHQREEAQRLEKDKVDTCPRNGGLFKGAFQPKPPTQQPVLDLEDNVFRCPECAWELEDDACAHCGYSANDDLDSISGTESRAGMSDVDENSEMTDYLDDEASDGFDGFGGFDALDGFDAVDYFFGHGGPPHMRNAFNGHPGYPPHHQPLHIPRFPSANYDDIDEDEDDDEDLDSEDADMDSFIDDDLNDNGPREPGSESDRSTVVGAAECPEYSTPPEHHEPQHFGTQESVSQVEDSAAESLDEDDSQSEISEISGEAEDDETEDEGRVLPTIRRRPYNHYYPGIPQGLSHVQIRRPSNGAGSSAHNAIDVDGDDDDEDDDGPVPPVRRARPWRNC